jgi:predicted transport protein
MGYSSNAKAYVPIALNIDEFFEIVKDSNKYLDVMCKSHPNAQKYLSYARECVLAAMRCPRDSEQFYVKRIEADVDLGIYNRIQKDQIITEHQSNFTQVEIQQKRQQLALNQQKLKQYYDAQLISNA